MSTSVLVAPWQPPGLRETERSDDVDALEVRAQDAFADCVGGAQGSRSDADAPHMRDGRPAEREGGEALGREGRAAGGDAERNAGSRRRRREGGK